MKLWHKNDDQREQVRRFERFMAAHPDVKFFQPSPLMSPWHVQAVIREFTLSFWPHKMKGQIENEKAVTGRNALDRIMQEAKSGHSPELIE